MNGDGCYDTNEADVTNATYDGSATDSLTIVTTDTTGVGANGFANFLETNEDGTPTYTPTYATYALDSTMNKCNQPPVITNYNSDVTAMLTYIENDTSAVINYDATDPDGETENGGGLTYCITGLDAHLFQIDALTGVLRWISPPDYESPLSDAAPPNNYEVTITVTDVGGLTDAQNLTISVNDFDEDGDGFTGSNDPDDSNPCVPNNAASPCCEADAPVITKD